ncbi:hypothetical protein GCK72_005982 [Caenorhabditis remanei]|uniref:G-protein coupled receptors family 1 profile domain-containing protein n=1 Tax=Caenorhabditis remanei TaxID=31234 RepID=A0A6A5HGZ0_CAERE|nr:hypothetical protein GCK72_005982 [Caenorhabditis remanei]KAF1766027.1 hypothetical protein GCK72_005982 [Caenorhabditis remanei]
MMESMDFHKIMAFIYLPTILIGVLGNILSLYAYSRPNRKSMVGFLLYSLSISDIFLLVFALPLFSIMYLPIWSDEQKSFVVAYTAKYVYPLCMMAKTCSLYIMVLITIERWIAVCRPLAVQIWCRYTTSSYSIAAIIIFAVVLNFARFFEFEIEYIDGLVYFKRELLDSDKHWWYFMFYFIIISIIFDYTVPFVIMFVANMLIISELRRTKKERSLMTIQQQKEQNTTVMLLVVTIFFGFCHFFSMALKIAESFAGGFLTIHNIYLEMLGEIFNYLIIIHTASTFFIYYIFSEKFRQIIKGIWTPEQYRHNSLPDGTLNISESKRRRINRHGSSTKIMYHTEGTILQKTTSSKTRYSRISSG